MLTCRKLLFYPLIFCFTISLWSSCATSRSKKSAKHNSIFQRVYHDVTTHYNYWFNAQNIQKEKLKEASKSATIDYNHVLDVYPINTETGKTLSGDMDVAHKKSSIAIQLHPTSKWVDDCYLVMGKSSYYKAEYDEAIKTFQFINSEFKNGNKLHKFKLKKTKSKIITEDAKIDMPDYTKVKETTPNDKEVKKTNKKKPSKKKSYKKKKKYKKKYKKKPKNHSKPKKDTETVNSNKEKSEKEQKDLALTIKIGGISKDMKKVVDADSADIAAENAKPIKKGLFYKIRHKPVTSESKIWLARTFTDAGKYSDAETVLNDIKNDPKFSKKLIDDYHKVEAHFHLLRGDYTNAKTAVSKALEFTKKKKEKARLNYILGQLYQKEDNFKTSRKYFQEVGKNKPEYEMEFSARMNILLLSLKDSTMSRKAVVNTLKKMSKDEKNLDYLDQIYSALADMSIEDGNIDQAIAYLKEATRTNTSNPNIKAKVYQKIADIYYNRNLYIAAQSYYDSTLANAKDNYPNYENISERKLILDELVPHLKTIIREDSLQALAKLPTPELNDILDDIIEKALLEQEQEEAPSKGSITESTISTAGHWYFYNNETKSKGYNDFIKKWGNRPLADNWRRSNKSVNTYLATEDSIEAELNLKIANGKINKSDLLKIIPNTSEKRKASDDKIIEALYQSGGIYDSRMQQNKLAIEAYTRLNTQYANNIYADKSYYATYLLYKKEKNTSKSNATAQLLRTNFPQSIYTKLLDNPNYIAESTQGNKEVNHFYEETYNLYINEKYKEVIDRKNYAETFFENNILQPKFDLLAALSYGKSQESKDSMRFLLEHIVIKYPSNETRIKAEELLLLLKGIKTVNTEAPSPEYKFDKNVKHYVMIIINSIGSNTVSTTSKISNHNTKTHSSDKLTQNTVVIDKDRSAILIKEFSNADKAKQYADELIADKTLFTTPDDVDAHILPIAIDNFNLFLKSKDLELYKKFATSNFK